jgi:hypothetical protein
VDVNARAVLVRRSKTILESAPGSVNNVCAAHHYGMAVVQQQIFAVQ